ncbi:MAG: amidohydrolase family protein, partial [Candidatus Bathyarchaeia archaeon]
MSNNEGSSAKTVNRKFFSRPDTARSAAGKLSGPKRSGKSSRHGKRPLKSRNKNRLKPSLNPSLVFLSGNVLTMDAARPKAEAIAVTADRIVAVGSNLQIKSLAGLDTKVLDLNGATVLPGFTDCHIHLIEYGLSLRNIDLRN